MDQQIDVFMLPPFSLSSLFSPSGKKTSKVITGIFNTSLSVVDSTTRQKTSQNIDDMNSVINKLGVIDNSGTLYPTQWKTHSFKNN